MSSPEEILAALFRAGEELEKSRVSGSSDLKLVRNHIFIEALCEEIERELNAARAIWLRRRGATNG